jgi:site-specific recombinase
MESQPKTMSEEETVRKVMALHEKGWGCRKIAATLRSEGVDTSKDKVWRMIKEHEVKGNEAEVEHDRGFKRLKQKEKVLQKRLDVQRKKEEYRRRIVNLIVELVMTNYQARRELFLDETKLLRFAETVMPSVDAQLWTDFKRYCKL